VSLQTPWKDGIDKKGLFFSFVRDNKSLRVSPPRWPPQDENKIKEVQKKTKKKWMGGCQSRQTPGKVTFIVSLKIFQSHHK
jgi:hypothetical protein